MSISWSQLPNSIYLSLARPAFVAGIALVLTGAMVGKSKFIQNLLGGSFWTPFARLNFFVYLIHMFIFFYYYGTLRRSNYLSTRELMLVFMSVVLLSFGLAVPCVMVMESPFANLEKLFLTPKKKEPEIEKVQFEPVEEKMLSDDDY